MHTKRLVYPAGVELGEGEGSDVMRLALAMWRDPECTIMHVANHVGINAIDLVALFVEYGTRHPERVPYSEGIVSMAKTHNIPYEAYQRSLDTHYARTRERP